MTNTKIGGITIPKKYENFWARMGPCKFVKMLRILYSKKKTKC